MSAIWNILTFAVPGKPHILQSVPSSPLRFSKGAKTTTQLGRLHPSLWVFSASSNQQLFSESESKTENSAQWHTNLQPWRTETPAILCGTQIIRDVCPPIVSQAAIRKLYHLFRRICDVCIVTSVPKWTDGTHQTRLPTPGLPGLRLPESRTGLLLGVVVVVVCRKINHQTFWTPQLSRYQRLTEFIGPKWVCWFNMMAVT